MKIKHLLIGMLAIAGAVACKPDQPVEEPVLEVNKTNVAIAATAGEGAFEVTANNAWTAAADADWVSLDPASGNGGDKPVKVKVTAEDNTAAEVRTATVTVKAGELTKTLKVTQAAAAAGPGDNVNPDAPTYILVGEAVGGWDVDKNGIVLTLKEGYYEAKGVAVTAKKGMHFTKNNKWEGNVKGLHGLIAPNEIGEVGNNDISLTEDGLYDVYLTEALDKFYFMTDGKLPSEAVEHVEIAVTWGICGAIEGNAWGAASDVELTADGEWLSAKDVTFTEVNFKIRGNNSWADDVKWGTAEKNQACELNKAVAVSTCTEFKAANPSEGDNPNIYIAAGAGTYDVYFSPDKKEVWVMTQGYKPGDEVPETPGPEQPDPETSTWALVGSFNGWDAAGSTAFLAVLDTDYFVYYGFEATANTEFKFVKDGKWASQGGAEIGGAIGIAEPNTIQTPGGRNIVIANAGKYDIYLASDLSKFYVMTEGKLPAEATEPAPVETTYTVVGTLNGINWNNNAPEGLLTKEGEYYVGKNVPFVTAKTLYGGADQFEFKVVETGTWNGYGAPAGMAAASANTEITLKEGGDNIPVKAAEGNYDVYFDKANAKVWVMEPGLKPGETPAEPEPEYTLDGKQWMAEVEGMQVLFDFGLTEESLLAIGLPTMDGTGFGLHMAGSYEIVPTDGTSGVVTFTQYDWEFEEFLDPVEIPYSELTATTVKAVSVGLFGTTEPVSFTLVENPYEIAPPQTGGDGPSGAIENGEYWFIEPTNQKVMTPLGETQNYGRMSAADAINGASTAKNAFTFTYNPDWSCYTIQDSYGRYLYSSMQSDGETPYRTLSVADNTPAADDENLAYYMWTVYNNGDGTYDVYNCATYYSISYSATYNNWEIYDPYEDDFSNLFPSLVKADNPVE